MNPVWRRLYSLASRLRAVWMVLGGEPPHAVVKALDLGVIMGGPLLQDATFALIAALHRDAAATTTTTTTATAAGSSTSTNDGDVVVPAVSPLDADHPRNSHNSTVDGGARLLPLPPCAGTAHDKRDGDRSSSGGGGAGHGAVADDVVPTPAPTVQGARLGRAHCPSLETFKAMCMTARCDCDSLSAASLGGVAV